MLSKVLQNQEQINETECWQKIKNSQSQTQDSPVLKKKSVF